jgi:hypothetical protein
LFFYAQSLTGLWVGALSNDSTTIRKDQSFEIALTEYKGKVYGYSRSEFIVNDSLFYIVKRVKGTIEGDLCEVTDDEIVSYNFRGKLDKGVKITSTFRRNRSDSTWQLDGTWKTNVTKKYYAVTGRVGLEEEKDLTASKIFPHLEELKLADNIAFYKERKEGTPVVKIVRPERNMPESLNSIDQITSIVPVIAVAQPGLKKAEVPAVAESSVAGNTSSVKNTESENQKEELPTLRKPVADLSKSDIKNIPSTTITITPTETTKTISLNTPPVEKTIVNQIIKAPNKKENNSSVVKTSVEEKSTPLAEKKEIITTSVVKNKNNPDTLSSVALHNPTSSLIKSSHPGSVKTNASVSTVPAVDKKEINALSVAKNTNKQYKPGSVDLQKATNKNNQIQGDKSHDVVVNKPPVNTRQIQTLDKPVAKEEVKTTASINKPTSDIKTSTPAPVVSDSELSSTNKPSVSAVTKSFEEVVSGSSIISGRKSEFSQVVNFKTDSLVLSLYDNGVIDGDTVSVYLNGKVLMSRQGLKSTAIRKTIYVTPGQQEDFTLVMFAESLGTLPPNTGLLVIHDGEDIYNLRFSSDFQKSSGIVLRRTR